MHIVVFVLSVCSRWHVSDIAVDLLLGHMSPGLGEGASLFWVSSFSQQWDKHFGPCERERTIFSSLYYPCQSGGFVKQNFQALSTLSGGKHPRFLIKISIQDSSVSQLLTCNCRIAKPCSDIYAFVVSDNEYVF